MTKKKSHHSKNGGAGKKRADLIQQIEFVSAGVPLEVLSAMQLQVVAWSIPEWVKLGPSQPSDEQITDLMERSLEAQLERLQAYWKEASRNV